MILMFYVSFVQMQAASTHRVRIARLKFVLLCVSIAFVAAGCAAHRTDMRPNVLFILLDDAGYGDVGCHGNRDVQTPTIDRLFSESTRLTRFYAQPVCTPSRACLMTGRDFMRTRAIDTLYRDMM